MATPQDFFGVPRDTPTVIDGMRDPSGMVTDRVKFDARDTLVLIEPKAAPFTTLTRVLKNPRTVGQYKFDMFEKDPLPRKVTCTSLEPSGETSIALTTGHGARVPANCLLYNPRTEEVIHTTSVSTDTLTVVRQIGGSGPAAINAGDELSIMGQAFEDGTTSGDKISTQEVNVYNYTQIFKRAIEWSGRQANTVYWGGNDRDTERRSQAIEIRKDIELCAFFGRRHTMSGSNSRLITTSGGLKQFATKNTWDLQGLKPNENQIVEALEWIMREGMGGSTYGKGVKWGFFPDRMITIIESFARDRIRYINPLGLAATRAGANARKLGVGLRVGVFTTSHGDLALVKTPLFRAPAAVADQGVIVDLEHIRPVTFRNRDLRMLRNQEANDADSSLEQWFGDLGWEITNAEAHTWLVNIPV